MNDKIAKEIAEYLNNKLKVKGVLDLSKDKPCYTFKTSKGTEIGLYMWEYKGKIFVNDLINGGYYGDKDFDSKIQETISVTEEWVESCIQHQRERRTEGDLENIYDYYHELFEM